MKKINLQEELRRIHEITYGVEAVNEKFMDKLRKRLGGKKVDDPKKADLVSDDVTEFYGTIENVIQSGGLSQQTKGTYEFQKGVESMQIGLMLLGYDLPRYGVDGLFGPETAQAVQKFTSENLNDANKKQITEVALSSPIGSTSINSPYGPRWGRMHHGIDLKANSGTPIKSPLDGEVIDAAMRSDACGGTIYIQHADEFRTRYCHCKQINVSKGQTVKRGDVIGLSGGASNDPGRGRSDGAHLHFELYKNGKTVNPEGYFGSEVGEFVASSKNSELSKATPEMLSKLLELLKERGVESDELKKYVDPIISITGATNENVYQKILEGLGAPITEENMKFMIAWRQSEGSGGKYNPFNTTQNMQGAISINSHGVKSYRTLEDGIIATIKTLKNGRYNCIVNGLVNDIGAENIARCESLKTWGTGDLVSKVIAGYDRGSRPNIKPVA